MKRRFEITLKSYRTHAFPEDNGKKDVRQDNLCGGAEIKHKNPLFVTFRYRKRLMVKTPFYKVRHFFDTNIQKWEEQLDKYGKSFVDEECFISYELFRQIKSALVINSTMGEKLLWERLSNAAKNVSSINLDKDTAALTPIVLNTCFVAYEAHRQEMYKVRNLDFPSPPSVESSVTGHESLIDSNSHRLKKLRKMSHSNFSVTYQRLRGALLLSQSVVTFMVQSASGLIQTTLTQLRQVRRNALAVNPQLLRKASFEDYALSYDLGYESTSFLWQQIPISQLTLGLIVADTLLVVKARLSKLIIRSPMIALGVVSTSFALLSLLLSANLTLALSTLVVSTLVMISLKLWLALFLN
jgi:hypothetical protein